MFGSKSFQDNLKAGVISGLLLLLIVQPLLGAAWALILRFGGRLFAGLVDSQYNNASLGKRDWIPAIFAIWCTMLMAGAALVSLVPTVLPEAWLRKWAETRRQRRLTHPTRDRIKRALVSLALLITALSLTGGIFLDLQLNASFEQRVNAIAPTVPDMKVKELRASWARMKSRQDYLDINAQLEQLAAGTGVAIPPPLSFAR